MISRVRPLNSAPVRPAGRYVLYWCQMNRRVAANQALDHAIALANEHGVPVLFYEALTFTYPAANRRLHTFILEGVPDNARDARALGLGYAFYLRRNATDSNAILYHLAANAVAVVTDDYPVFIAATHNASVPAKLDVACAAVDASCIVPLAAFPAREWAAYTIRPKIRKLLLTFLYPAPPPAPRVPWGQSPFAWQTEVEPADIPQLVANCAIDQSIAPSTAFQGGARAAADRLARFIQHALPRYASQRNEPTADATSGLSPYLHFGHISALTVATAAAGSPEFLEELIVRRELAFNYCRHTQPPDRLENLPRWALETLRKHDSDPRAVTYTYEQFERAATSDPLWNAAQRQLLETGVIHGYYRMYWGKKIIEWSPTHASALRTMVRLHDVWALDGRDPNTYTNILWCFGLHDRPWTERSVFGQIRWMSAEGMRRKTRAQVYVDQWHTGN
ncbi:MAG: deoxyribodipyrimidine photo-lyase [Acidobacteria bacterium]|nr:deoxyribodipyrimidine photo-lyase [Acidobacteriota bacterium]